VLKEDWIVDYAKQNQIVYKNHKENDLVELRYPIIICGELVGYIQCFYPREK